MCYISHISRIQWPHVANGYSTRHQKIQNTSIITQSSIRRRSLEPGLLALVQTALLSLQPLISPQTGPLLPSHSLAPGEGDSPALPPPAGPPRASVTAAPLPPEQVQDRSHAVTHLISKRSRHPLWMSGAEDPGERQTLTLLGGSLPRRFCLAPPIRARNRTDPISEPKDAEGSVCLPQVAPTRPQAPEDPPGQFQPKAPHHRLQPPRGEHPRTGSAGAARGGAGIRPAGSRAAPHSPPASAAESRLTTSAQPFGYGTRPGSN